MLGMIINFAVAIIVCRMTTPIPQDVVDMVESIRFPKGAGGAQDH
jgi:cation/acetate symporter